MYEATAWSSSDSTVSMRCRLTTKLTCPAGAGSNELQKAYMPAGSGAAPGSASGLPRKERRPEAAIGTYLHDDQMAGEQPAVVVVQHRRPIGLEAGRREAQPPDELG